MQNARRNKLSRRKKAKAKQTLEKAVNNIVTDLEKDALLKNRLFLKKPSDSKIVVGNFTVEKTKSGQYNVLHKGAPLYRDLYAFDAAMAIVEALNIKNTSRALSVLKLEEEYCKNYLDMQSFRRAIERLKTTDKNHAAIYEDRYIVVKQRALIALENIKRFRIA
jgi:hypothetical protein